jgi:hypothetical protein
MIITDLDVAWKGKGRYGTSATMFPRGEVRERGLQNQDKCWSPGNEISR